jgi:hypothetical protein
MSLTKEIGKRFASLDIFGENVSVYYRGKQKYKTKFGAFCTLVISVLLAFLSYKKLVILFNKDDPTI